MAVHSLPDAPVARRSLRDYLQTDSLIFILFHLVPVIGVAISGWSWSGLGLAVLSYYVGMFFVTAGYHRYFAHRTFKTSRVGQFIFALGATMTAQKGVLWWAAHHRTHHKLSDQPGDIHSVRQDGFWYSHMGSIVGHENDATDFERIKDFARYPELRWLNAYWYVPVVGLAVALFAIGGWHALLWGFFVGTTIRWHGTFTINSLSHLFGRRRYETSDDSRNNWFLALLTMGEGWHNNHHHFQGSVNQGFKWYEVDASYYLLRLLAVVGLVWDLKVAPAHIVAGTRKRPRAVRPTPAAVLDEAA